MNIHINKPFKRFVHGLCALNILLIIGGSSISLSAQNSKNIFADSKAFSGREQLEYQVSFKWGIIRGKAGTAYFDMKPLNSTGQWFHQLRFLTSGLFETAFPMRDTLEVLYGTDKQPLRWEKRVNEGGHYLRDELTYTYLSNKVRVNSRRANLEGQLIDTVLVLPNHPPVTDMLSAFTLVRAVDRSKVKLNYRQPFVIIIGRSVVKAEIVYNGRDAVRLPDGSDVEAFRFNLNIYDPAFSNPNQAAEVWVTDDKYMVPIRVRAKLKVGYAECELKSMTRR